MSTRPLLLPSVAVALLALALYLPALRNGFAYDAVAVVEQDARIHTLAHAPGLLAASYWAEGEELHALYRPLVTLSFAFDWALYRGRPAGFHFTNAVAHAAATALVFLLLAHFTTTPRTAAPPRKRGANPRAALDAAPAFVGALLFAAHPAQVESVASVIGRAEIFTALFAFAALLLWLRRPAASRSVRFGVPVLFLLALGAKESAVMLPALLTLADIGSGTLRRDRLSAWLQQRWRPFALMLVVFAGYMALRFAVLGTFAPAQVDPVLDVVPAAGDRIRTALQVWPHIARLLFLPWTLLADYGPRILLPAEGWSTLAVTGLLLLVGTIAAAVAAFSRGHRRVGVALLWVPIALLPVTNLLLPIGVLLAERTLYLPLFALALGVAAALDTLLLRVPLRRHVALAVAGALVLLCAARTVARIPAWRSTDVLLGAQLRDRPDSFRAHWHHARMAWRDQQYDRAVAYYRSAIELWPHRRALVHEAARFATEVGRPLEAREFAQQALTLWPDDLTALRRLAALSLDLNDTATARTTVTRGLRRYPNDPLLRLIADTLGIPPRR